MTVQDASPVVKKLDHEEQVDAGLQAVERQMYAVTNSEVTVLRDASHHILDAGGKRIRPRIVVLSYLALGGTDVEQVSAPAAAVELMHTASVVHDDINDHGVMRRGRPSINSIWGRTFALLTGDFLFTAVYQLMAPHGNLNQYLAQAATALVEGETLQASAVKEQNFTREVYNRIISLKTAALFECAAKIGAEMADGREKQVAALAMFGFNVGLAFQIVDDVLDIVADEATLGKTAGIDIEQGRGIGAISDNEDNTDKIVDSIKRKMLEGDRLDQALAQARELVAMAVNALEILPDSPAKDDLIETAYQVVNRDH